MVAAGNFNIHECYKRPEARTVHKAAVLSTYTKIEVKLTSKTLFFSCAQNAGDVLTLLVIDATS